MLLLPNIRLLLQNNSFFLLHLHLLAVTASAVSHERARDFLHLFSTRWARLDLIHGNPLAFHPLPPVKEMPFYVSVLVEVFEGERTAEPNL